MSVFDLIAQNGSLRQIHLMLESGFDVNGRNNYKETALIVCVSSIKDSDRRISVIKTLLKFNPDINLQDCRGRTAFIHACILEQKDTVNLLLLQPTVDVNISDENGNTGFMYVCKKGKKNLVKMLVDAHIKRQICLDLNKVNNEGKTASQIATENQFTAILPVLNTLESHKNYAKPVLCVPSENGGQDLTRNKRKFNLSAIKRVLHEAYMSDDEDEGKNSNDKQEMTDLVNAMRECATDIRQIYHDREANAKLSKIQFSNAKANSNKNVTNIFPNPNGKDKESSKKRHDAKRFPARENKHRKQVNFEEEPPIRIIRPIRLQEDTSKSIHINGLKLTTNGPGTVSGRRIVLSDTSTYDKNLAIKPKPKPSDDEYTNRRVRGATTSLPLSIIGKPNKLATKLPYRKVWTSLEQGQFELEKPMSPPPPSLKLPPLKECFQTREHKESAVKNIDRDMWKIIQSYKG